MRIPDDPGARRDEPAAAVSQPSSLLRRWPAFVLLVVVIADAWRTIDPDLPGHLSFGHQMLRLCYLPRRDTYSYSAPGHLSGNHEWLADVVMGLIYDACGIPGLKMMKFALTAATIVLIAAAEAETAAPLAVQAAVLLGAGITLIPFMQFRPQLFSFVSLAALLLLLVREDHKRPVRLWLAVPLLALWANLHGGFFVGIAVLATYSVAAVVRERARGDRPPIGALLLLTGAATAATLANPYGIGLWVTIAHALENPFTRTLVNDWRPLWERMAVVWRVGYAPFLLLYCPCLAVLAGIALSLMRGFRARDLPLVVIAALMGMAGMISARNVPLFAIAAAVPLAGYAGALVSVRERARLADRASRAQTAVAPDGLGHDDRRRARSRALYGPLHAQAEGDPAAGGRGGLHAKQRAGRHRARRLWMGRLSDLADGAQLEGIYRRALRDGLSRRSHPGLRGFLPRQCTRRASAQSPPARLRPGSAELQPGESGLQSKDWKPIYADAASVLFIRAASPAAASFYIPVRGPAPSPFFP